MTNEKLLVQALKGEITPRVPFWFMRQAGRYLPEYREVRATTKGFLDMCFTPEKAAEVTLQPLRRFQMDAAILFSDILVVPYGLGVDVNFVEGEGPRVGLTNTDAAIAALDLSTVRSKLEPVAETIRILKKRMPEDAVPDAALIGFAGAPWTVACYMLQGKSGKEFQDARLFALSQPGRMETLIQKLTAATIDYLRMQIDAGVDAVQIFDSWAGLLTEDQFRQWVIYPTQLIVQALRESHPETPIIGFPKGAGLLVMDYAEDTLVDCIGIDQFTNLEYAIEARAFEEQAIQGNLDPLLIAANKREAVKKTEHILSQFAEVPAVFNLGHGFIPSTPIEHIAAVAEMVRAWRR